VEDDPNPILEKLREVNALLFIGRWRGLIVPVVLVVIVWLAGAPSWVLLALVALAVALNVERWLD
jgi:hypothetical protein